MWALYFGHNLDKKCQTGKQDGEKNGDANSLTENFYFLNKIQTKSGFSS